MKSKLLRILEEVMPFVYFLAISRKYTLKGLENCASEEQLNRYSALTDDILQERLTAEHDRASKIDEKTSKFTLGLSISLSVISALSSNIVKIIPVGSFGDYISPLFIISSIYMLSGGVVSLGALKTLPKYGYGTEYEMDGSENKLSKALICQERVNLLRHARNEASFMSLRNGFLLIFIALVLCATIVVMKLFVDFCPSGAIYTCSII